MKTRTVLSAGVALAMCAGLGACTAPTERNPTAERWTFTSDPDLDPPVVEVSPGEQPDRAASDMLSFIAPKADPRDPSSVWTGGLILDDAGEPVWIRQDAGSMWDLRVQEYRDEPVLTWWEGEVDTPEAAGEVVVMDTSYTEVARVGVGSDLPPGSADLHETTITDDGTMFLLVYVKSPADLRTVGGPAAGFVWEGVVQEVDIATGDVVFEWRSLEDIPVEHSQEEIEDGEGTEGKPFDYFHVNSVSEDDDGSLLISARNTHAVYRLDRATADLDWILGGSNSDFTMPEEAYFAWQHDAQRRPDGTLTLFDNQASPKLATSRGLRLDLDTEEMVAEVVTEYLPTTDRVSANQGNMQELANGNVVIGWGAAPYFSEYTHDGELVSDTIFTEGSNYRAYRHEWHATPAAPPKAVIRIADGGRNVHVSWNGATEAAAWRVLSGQNETDLREVNTVESTGFETQIEVPADGSHIVVNALDADGEVIGSTVAE